MKKFTISFWLISAALSACNNTSTSVSKESIAAGSDSATVNIKDLPESIKASAPTPKNEKEVKKIPNETAVPAKQIPLTIVVEKLASDNAPIEMTIYSPNDNFLSAKSEGKKYRWRPKKGKAVTKIQNLKYGDFAIALYQDVNDNGKIDKNMIGIPEEPFAFSNDYKPVIKAPSFNDCRFSYNESQNTITITLQN